MRKLILNIVFILTTLCSLAQEKKDYKVYQFEQNDSLNGHFSKIVRYNEDGLKSYEELIDYKVSKLSSFSDYIDNHFYSDTLLIKTQTTYNNSERKAETTFEYNSDSQLIKETVSSYERRLKKDLKKGIEYGDCIIEEEDYEKNPSWEIETEKFFKYNLKGQLIETYAPEKSQSRQNRYLYRYNYDGLIEKVTSLENNEIIWEEFRENFKNGNYDYIRLWSNDFTFKNVCRSVGAKRFKYDSRNNLIEKSRPDETGIRGIVKTRFYYDDNDVLIKQERYNSKDELEITHIYIYE
ncbi:hypothetical protein [uncultured Dokdonia sp.]|uniref:hypothetical protein n=1 Tax=uncultured Dokdonia sp. TaxID=575653 RepID=UPI002639DE3A|nr:hypothetical protein [uncultured Dokdonia sp.]